MKIVLQDQFDWLYLIDQIRNKFGDDRLFFTFTPFRNEEICDDYLSTFSDDNLERFPYWGALMHAKLQSGSIDGISIVFRVFLNDTINLYERRKKLVLPKKEIYHFLVTPDSLALCTVEETKENQNTDSLTGKPLKHQKDLIYKSSIDLCDQLIKI
ncbi:MAG: hypothetical protein ACTSXA_07060 [Candidatus Heimdallarchaeota archaeon]